MDIIEITRQLGKAIQNDERYKKLAEAQKVNDADENLQALIGEFNIINMNLEKVISGDEQSKEKAEEYTTAMRELYFKIMQTEGMKNYQLAKKDMDELMKRVNGILELCLAGEDPETCEPQAECSGNCASCGGCH